MDKQDLYDRGMSPSTLIRCVAIVNYHQAMDTAVERKNLKGW